MRSFRQKGSFLGWLTKIVLGVVLLGTSMSTPGHAGAARGALDPQWEAALLQEDWGRVVTLLSSGKPLSPVAQFVKAHAYLALNQNNASLCSFRSVLAAENLRRWDEWTQELVTHHPATALAHYLRGDALARLQQWDAARQAFNEALGYAPNHPLVLNARGVAYAATREWDQALIAFQQATAANPNFADAHASEGALYMQMQAGPEGALAGAQRALEIAPAFALALNTHGCANVVLQEWGEAQHDFEAARKQTTCLPVVFTNIAAATTRMNAALAQELTRLADAHPGVTMQQVVKGMAPGERERLGKIVTGFRDHSSRALGVLEAIPSQGAVLTPQGRAGYEINLDTWRASTREHLTRYNAVLRAIGGPQPYTNRDLKAFATAYAKGTIPGGVTTSMQHAYIDKGHWTCRTQYGLLYPVEGQEHFAGGAEGTRKRAQ